MLEKILPSLPHITPRKIVKTASKYRNTKYQKGSWGLPYLKEILRVTVIVPSSLGYSEVLEIK